MIVRTVEGKNSEKITQECFGLTDKFTGFAKQLQLVWVGQVRFTTTPWQMISPSGYTFLRF